MVINRKITASHKLINRRDTEPQKPQIISDDKEIPEEGNSARFPLLSGKRIERIIVAFLIVIIYGILVSPYFQAVQSTSNDISTQIANLTKSPEPYTFQIPLFFSFNGTVPFVTANETDFSFLLTFTYPNGTLVTNETVYINATGVFDKVVTTLDYVGIIFPNSLSSPISRDEHGIPKQGILIFPNPISGATARAPSRKFW